MSDRPEHQFEYEYINEDGFQGVTCSCGKVFTETGTSMTEGIDAYGEHMYEVGTTQASQDVVNFLKQKYL